MNEFVLFTVGQGNPLFSLGFRPELTTSLLWPSAVIICLLLGHATYTDLARGRVIRNGTTGALLCVSAAIIPFIYQHPGKHLITVAAVLLGLGFLYIIGAVAEGDVKLYAGLVLLLGKAAVALFFISWILIILYSIPIIIVTWKARRNRKRDGEQVLSKFGQRLGAGPGGPGIALAFPLTLWAMGLPSVQVLGLIGVEALAAAWLYFDHWLERYSKRKQELGQSGVSN